MNKLDGRGFITRKRSKCPPVVVSILTTMGPLLLKSIPPGVPASRDGFSVPDVIPPCPVSVRERASSGLWGLWAARCVRRPRSGGKRGAFSTGPAGSMGFFVWGRARGCSRSSDPTIVACGPSYEAVCAARCVEDGVAWISEVVRAIEGG